MSSNNRRIQRVPALLIAEDEDEMKKKKNDYYPQVASIGPYHYGAKPELAQVEAFKPVAVDLLVRGEKDFFYQKVLAMIGQVRNCYEKESVDKFSDADLAQMMLRDASLIIAEMEIYLERGETYHIRKAMIDHFGRLTGAVLFRDFILVENQIPLCVIQLLIELRHGAGTAPEMINNYVNKCIFGEIRRIVKYSRVPLHLLEFMHIILVQPQEPPTETSNRSIKECWRGILFGAPNHTLAPNHTVTLGPRKPATETSNRSIEEGSRGKSGGAPEVPNHTLTLVPRKPPIETSNRSIEEGCGGKSGGAPEVPKAPNHSLKLVPLKPPTETSNRSIEEGWRGKKGGAPNHTLTLARVEAPNRTLKGAPDHTLTLGDPPFRVVEARVLQGVQTEASNWSIEESCSGELGAPGGTLKGAPDHTLTLGDPPFRVVEARVLQRVQTEASNWSIEESSSGELGAPGGPNLTLTLGPHKPPTEMSSNRSILDEEDIVVMAPNHTLMLGSPQHATETSNKAKKGTHSFRKVMELKARGIHFRPSATQSLLDVKFESGFFYATLQLPEMFVSHYSKPFFKNLVAYELLPGVETEPKVTSYIKLMQSLVERPEDLEELRERKIVYNQLGSDEEALNVFKDINTHGASDDELYLRVREKIQKHYNNRIKTWIAELIHTHFRSPWTFAAFLAAAAIIALTAAQLYYAVHPVADKTPTSS